MDIPYYVLDYTASFSENVIDNFVDMYAQGLTPNPCVECNRSVKFDHFIDQANKLKWEKVATGHYAKILKKNNIYELHKADYLDKDQSYVLHMLDSQKLENIEFPLGTISKPEVRQIAASLGLKTAFKKDSQDICFVGKKDYRNFVSKRIDVSSKGLIVDKNENEMGTHGGIHAYTIGQRKGVPGGQGEAKYVTKIDVENNKIYIGSKDELTTKKFIFIIFSQSLFRFSVRIIFKFIGIKPFRGGKDNICKQDGVLFTRFLNLSISNSIVFGKTNFLVLGSFFA